MCQKSRPDTFHSPKPIDRGLVPTDGSDFEVETSEDQHFKTRALVPENRLKERGTIREFYEKAKIRGGDKVIWQEIGPRKYRLSKLIS
jgi:hypothetical protein